MARMAVRHQRATRSSRPPAGTASKDRDGALAGGGGATAADSRHLERGVQYAHDQSQRGSGLRGSGPRLQLAAEHLTEQERGRGTEGGGLEPAAFARYPRPTARVPIRSRTAHPAAASATAPAISAADRLAPTPDESPKMS